MVHDYGTIQGTPLDNIRSQESILASVSNITDINKNRPEEITAQVISGGIDSISKMLYKVKIDNSGEEREAILGYSPEYWKRNGYPKQSDFVKIQTTRECSFFIITGIIDKETYNYNLNKRYVDGQLYYFRWDNTETKNEDMANSSFWGFAKKFETLLGFKWASVATQP